MTEFTGKVSSTGSLNIPKNIEELLSIDEGDFVTVEIIEHKKQEET